MKITKRQFRRIIKEELATVNDDAIEDIVMGILGDEGGAAGLDPIEDALNDLEDDEVSLPDESIEDIISSVAGVKQHADGDYVDVTQLEGMKITKRQLRRIIKEEKAKILAESADVKDIMALENAVRNIYGSMTTDPGVDQSRVNPDGTYSPVSRDPKDMHDEAVKFLMNEVSSIINQMRK